MTRETLMWHETHGIEELAKFINGVIKDENKTLVEVRAYASGTAHVDYWKKEVIKEEKILVW